MPGSNLAGVRVLVTRPAHQADHLAGLIEAAGGSAVRFPVVEILDPEDSGPLFSVIERLHEFDLAVFISPNAVNKAMNLIQARGGWPSGLAVACVGKGSAKELRRFGITDPIAPRGRFDSEALLERPELADMQGRKVVIFRGDGGREVLGNTLAGRGAEIDYAECYRRARPKTDVSPLLRLWARGGIDVVTLTSVQGLRNLFDLLGKLGQQWLIKTPAIVVSERIAQACRELGYKAETRIASEASDEAIVTEIEAWRGAQKSL